MIYMSIQTAMARHHTLILAKGDSRPKALILLSNRIREQLFKGESPDSLLFF
jgi:hypothetical protein